MSMELFRYCRVCDTENPENAPDCSRCEASILDVVPEPKREALVEQGKIQEPYVTLSFDNGGEIIVHSGGIVGRSYEGKELLREYNHVSRKHVVIQNIEGIWTVRDEATLNGTFLNGEKIEAGIWKKIKTGDSLELSPTCQLVITIG